MSCTNSHMSSIAEEKRALLLELQSLNDIDEGEQRRFILCKTDHSHIFERTSVSSFNFSTCIHTAFNPDQQLFYNSAGLPRQFNLEPRC